MAIKIIATGKLKERFYDDACKEYLKRLGAYADVEIIEVADEKTDSPVAVINEGERILKKLPHKSYKIALCIDGKSFSSEGLSEHLSSVFVSGYSEICFIIGGSHGLSQAVISACDCKLSFSKMTFPHQLMRVILLEQIYRAFKIMKGEPYHK